MSGSNDVYSIRKFEVTDWQALKTMRLYSLQQTPEVYCSNYDRENNFPDTEWQRRLSEPGCAYFGLYHGEELVGITGVFGNDGSTEEAILVSSFILPDHRNKGLSALMYKARIDWAKARDFKHIIVSHRAGNMASKAANQRFGFVFTHKENRLWPDGAEAENIYYKLEL